MSVDPGCQRPGADDGQFPFAGARARLGACAPLSSSLVAAPEPTRKVKGWLGVRLGLLRPHVRVGVPAARRLGFFCTRVGGSVPSARRATCAASSDGRRWTRQVSPAAPFLVLVLGLGFLVLDLKFLNSKGHLLLISCGSRPQNPIYTLDRPIDTIVGFCSSLFLYKIIF